MMNNNFRAQLRRFGPMVISIFGILTVVFCLVACVLNAQRHKDHQKTVPLSIAKEEPIVESSDVSTDTPLSIKEFEYDGKVYLLIEKPESSSFFVILK